MGRVTRRRLLIGGAATVVAGAAGFTYGEVAEILPGHTQFRQYFGLDGADGTVPDVPVSVTMEHEQSAARGVGVQVAVMSPAGMSRAGLPVVVVLHGRSGSAQGMVDLGFPQFLTAAVRAGVAPFVLVAPDGGDNTYWHAVASHGHRDDPQAMLLNELPAWLSKYGLSPSPTGAIGISMGGFGALLYARNRRTAGTALASVAAISPAIFQDWPDASTVGTFADQADWAANEPLQHVSALAGERCGIWCGGDDPFHDAAQAFARELPATTSQFAPGAHDDGYWRRVLPDALRFLG